MLDWLKEILGEGYTEQIGRNFVAKSDFNAVNQTKKDLEQQLATATDTIEALKKSDGDTEKLRKTISEHEQTIAKLQKDAENAAKTNVIREQLRTMGVKAPDYIIFKQGGIEKFAFDENGSPKKLEDTVKTFRENAAMAYLFGDSQQHYVPAGGTDVKKNPFAKETYNLTEQGRLYRENQQLAEEMAAAAGVKI